uniref:Uncharacterized protein n=2 Tax=Fagus sylvatica TaxID=28930 RepID=A0A2N9IKC7_FAGSY
MTVLRELWYCHVAESYPSTPAAPSNPPRFPCAYPFFIRFSGAVLEVFWNSKWVMRHIVGKLSTSSFQRYKVCANRSSDEGVMAPGSRGIGAVFVHSSGEDSGQTGDAIGEPRVPRRSRSHYLSNAPGLADQLVASRKDSAREGGFFRSGIPADPDKFLAIREFHVVHGCVLFPMCPGSQINLLRVRKTLCASAATSVGKFRKFQHSLISSACFHVRAWPCTEASLGSQDMILRTGGRRNVPYAKGPSYLDENDLKSSLVWLATWAEPLVWPRKRSKILHCSVCKDVLSRKVNHKEFTEKKTEFVERKTVEHLLKKPCFIDCKGFLRSTPFLLEHVPSYNSFQNTSRVKDLRQVEVTISRPGKSTEAIIEAIPISKRKVPVPLLVTPLADPYFIPAIPSLDISLPEIRFPSLFDPTPKPTEEMPIQKRSISLGSILERSDPTPTSDALPTLIPPLGFTQGEMVMKKVVKRKRGEEDDGEEVGEQQLMALTEPLKSPISASKGKSKNDRATRKANVVGKSLLFPKDMKSWQENSFEHVIENLKRNSVFSVQGIFKVGSRLLETKRLLREALVENVSLKELEKTALTKIHATESQHKSAEAGLMTTEHQVRELKAKYDDEFNRVYELRVENQKLLADLKAARAEVKKTEDAGWDSTLDQAGVDDASDLYNMGRKLRLYEVAPTEETEETAAEDPQDPEQVLMEDVNEGADEDATEEEDIVEI